MIEVILDFMIDLAVLLCSLGIAIFIIRDFIIPFIVWLFKR